MYDITSLNEQQSRLITNIKKIEKHCIKVLRPKEDHRKLGTHVHNFLSQGLLWKCNMGRIM